MNKNDGVYRDYAGSRKRSGRLKVSGRPILISNEDKTYDYFRVKDIYANILIFRYPDCIDCIKGLPALPID